MCEYNKNIKKMADPNQKLELLIMNMSNQIQSIRTDLTNYIDSNIGHLNNNIKSQQAYIAEQFGDIKEQLQEVKQTRKEDRQELLNKLDKADVKMDGIGHDIDCPQNLDIEVRSLKDTFRKFEIKLEDLYKNLGFFIAVKQYKIIQFALLILMIVFVLMCYNSFKEDKTQRDIQKIENTLQMINK